MSRKHRWSFASVAFVVSLLLMPVSGASAAVNWGGGTSVTYNEGSNAIVVAPSLTVTDSDIFMNPGASTGTVTISSGLSSGDTLSLVETGYSGGNCITTSSFNSSTGVLSLSGDSGGCNYPMWSYWREAFRSVRFSTTADTPDSTRVLQFKSSAGSSTLSVTVNVTASAPAPPATPSVVAGDGSATITVGQASSGLAPRSHVITSNPLGKTCTIAAATGSCTISGLENGTAYTFTSTAKRLSASSVASAPSVAVTPTATTVATPTTVPAKATSTSSTTSAVTQVAKGRTVSSRSLARRSKMKVAASSRVTIVVRTSSRSICRVSGTRVLGLKVGSCRLKITVTPTKGKASSRNVILTVSK